MTAPRLARWFVGDTKAEALRVLADALTLHEGGGEPVTDEDLEEWASSREPEERGATGVPAVGARWFARSSSGTRSPEYCVITAAEWLVERGATSNPREIPHSDEVRAVTVPTTSDVVVVIYLRIPRSRRTVPRDPHSHENVIRFEALPSVDDVGVRGRVE